MHKGHALSALGRHEEAQEAFAAAREDASAIGSPDDLVASILFGEARCAALLGDLERAEGLIREGLARAKSGADATLVCAGLEALAFLLRRRLEFGASIEVYRGLLQQLSVSGDMRQRAHALGGLGLAYLDIGDLSNATEVLQERLDLLRTVGDRHGEASTLNTLVRVFTANGDLARATECGREASDLFLLSRDSYNSAIARRNLGRVYQKAQNSTAAVNEYREALGLFRQHGASDQVARIERELARL